MGREKKNPWAASALNPRTISTCDAVSTHSTMADIPNEWAMWITVSTTSRLIPCVDSRPAMKEPSIFTVLTELRLNGSKDDQLVPTSSTESCTPISEMFLRSAAADESTMASSVTSRVSCPLLNPVSSSAVATALDTSPRRSWWIVQFTPSWMLGDQWQAFSHASIRIQRVRGPMSPLTSAWGIRRLGEISPWVG